MSRRRDAYRSGLTVAQARNPAPGVRLLFDAAPIPPGEHPDRRELTGGERAFLAVVLAHVAERQHGGER